MDATTERKLAAIARYATAYEAVAVGPNGERRLIAYCNPKSRDMLLKALRKRSAPFVALTGCAEVQASKRAADGFTAGPWAIRYSGRTQREAILAGEHARI